MGKGTRGRFWLETTLGSLSGLLAIATLIHKDWIEEVFGVDPDGGSGSLEWLLVAVLLVAAVLLGGAARREWRRLHALPSGSPG
jgi:hypothetical protein